MTVEHLSDVDCATYGKEAFSIEQSADGFVHLTPLSPDWSVLIVCYDTRLNKCLSYTHLEEPLQYSMDNDTKLTLTATRGQGKTSVCFTLEVSLDPDGTMESEWKAKL